MYEYLLITPGMGIDDQVTELVGLKTIFSLTVKIITLWEYITLEHI